MNNSLHYLLMANHLLFQKSLHAGIKDTNMTPGQPKILDYLLDHDGIVQKEISKFCHMPIIKCDIAPNIAVLV